MSWYGYVRAAYYVTVKVCRVDKVLKYYCWLYLSGWYQIVLQCRAVTVQAGCEMVTNFEPRNILIQRSTLSFAVDPEYYDSIQKADRCSLTRGLELLGRMSSN